MKRRKRTLFIAVGAFVFCSALVLSTAYSQGADPLHPRSRHIWGLSLLAAAYVSYRGAIIFEKLLSAPEPGKPQGAGRLNILAKKDHAIDRRMAARRARVAAAKERSVHADGSEGERTHE